jgi:Mn2+/Fe2+ NRAMP family transporter
MSNKPKFNNIKKTKKEISAIEGQVIDKVLTLVMSALGFVAALAWNDAIQTTFKTFFGEQSELWAKYIYAVILTTIVVIISIQLDKALKKIKKEKEDQEIKI